MIKLNRGQALAIWSAMVDCGPDVQFELREQRGDGEIWGEAISEEFGKRLVVFPAAGGHEFPGDRVQEAVSGPETDLGESPSDAKLEARETTSEGRNR